MGIMDEVDAVERMLRDAETFGYGNFIAHLKKAWAERLMAEGLDEKTALEAADVAAYPSFGISEKRRKSTTKR